MHATREAIHRGAFGTDPIPTLEAEALAIHL